MRTASDHPVAQPVAPDPQPVPTLAYANPRVFFAGAHRYRSPLALLGLALGAAVALGLGYVAVQIMWNWGVGEAPAVRWGWAAMVALAAALMAFGTAYGAWGWVECWEVPVRVTEEGVEHGRRVWPWQEISDFGGNVAGPGGRVQLLFVPAGRRQIRFPRNLWTTPSLSAAEFADLVGRLTPYLAEHHPHVQVDPTPKSSG